MQPAAPTYNVNMLFSAAARPNVADEQSSPPRVDGCGGHSVANASHLFSARTQAPDGRATVAGKRRAKEDTSNTVASTVQLQAHIQAHIEKLKNKVHEVPTLLKHADGMNKMVETLVVQGAPRYATRALMQLRRCSEITTSHAHMLSSEEHVRRFEKKVLPYTNARIQIVNDFRRKRMRSSTECTSKIAACAGPKDREGRALTAGRGVGSHRHLSMPGDASSGVIDAFVQLEKGDESRQVIAEYLTDLHGKPPQPIVENRDACNMCGSSMRLVVTKSLLMCQKCGYSVVYLDATTSSVAYTDDVTFPSFSYKRLNHFNEWMQQVQGKESFEVSQSIVDAVMLELYKQRVTLQNISQRKIREVLKTLKIPKTYEHVAQITSRITGVPTPQMTSSAEEMCRLLFIAMQPAFEKHCPEDRKNFLSYSYVLCRFCILLGLDEFIDSFALLKGRDKLEKQELLFEKICHEMDWEFTPLPVDF